MRLIDGRKGKALDTTFMIPSRPGRIQSGLPCVLRLWSRRRRILTVECPLHGIVQNVFSDAVQGFFVAADVVIIIALPSPTRSRSPTSSSQAPRRALGW